MCTLSKSHLGHARKKKGRNKRFITTRSAWHGSPNRKKDDIPCAGTGGITPQHTRRQNGALHRHVAQNEVGHGHARLQRARGIEQRVEKIASRITAIPRLCLRVYNFCWILNLLFAQEKYIWNVCHKKTKPDLLLGGNPNSPPQWVLGDNVFIQDIVNDTCADRARVRFDINDLVEEKHNERILKEGNWSRLSVLWWVSGTQCYET